jgi:DNA-binding NarL/FixJ family response regulator
MQQLIIIIADDHPLFRGALRQAVTGIEGQQTIIEAGDFEAARAAAAQQRDADLLLLDLAMPGVSGFSGLMALRAEFSSLPIVIVSATDDATTVRRAVELGASGFISKSCGIEEIRLGIQSVLEGDVWVPKSYQGGKEHDPDVEDLIRRLRTLTPQQSRVLGMLAEGLLNKQIAYELRVSEATIKAHVSAILLKLKVDSRTQAVIQLSKINSSALVA